MSDVFLAEIRIFTGNFPPAGWAFCNGQVLAISQNTALFSLIGTIYGGNGTTSFALPNLQGSMPLGNGQGPGLTPRNLGEAGGVETVTLTESEMPAHVHTMLADGSEQGTGGPAGAVFASGERGRPPAYGDGTTTVQMSPLSLSASGGSMPHNNLPPYLAVSFIIALQGIYPSRP